MTLRLFAAALLLSATAATPVAAQFQSKSYKFLQAVKDGKGQDVVDMLDTPGSTIINTKDPTSGEGALHIIVKRGDQVYLRYLLSRGADPNLRDGRGNTPLLLAVQYGQTDLIPVLLEGNANPNLGNSGGETPLIRAVQRRDVTMVRALLAAKANPDQSDSVAGMSARDYAHADDRSPVIAKMIDDVPKGSARATAGPKF